MIAMGKVPQLVSQNHGQFVFRFNLVEQTGKNNNIAAWQSESIDLVAIRKIDVEMILMQGGLFGQLRQERIQAFF